MEPLGPSCHIYIISDVTGNSIAAAALTNFNKMNKANSFGAFARYLDCQIDITDCWNTYQRILSAFPYSRMDSDTSASSRVLSNCS